MASLLPFRDINVHASATHYAFTSPSSPSAPTLVIDRPSGDIRLNDGTLLGGKRVSSIAGILGVIKLRLDKYIIVITKAQPMGKLKGHMVYKVISTELLALRDRPLHDPDEDTYITILKTLLRSSPLFFSYSFDLTSSFQRQSSSDLSLPLWKRGDDRFFWNRFAQSDLIDFRNGDSTGMGARQQGRHQPGADPYILPVIFGMMSIKSTSVMGKAFTFALITRRSRHRGGTRYFRRGIDDQGHAANFNETEQIVIVNDATGTIGSSTNDQNGRTDSKEAQVMSYVQTRGSVPVYWAEVNTLHYTPKLQIKGIDTAVPAARLHFQEQVAIYGDNYLVNLVNNKGREERVKKGYENIVRLLSSSTAEQKLDDEVSSESVHVVEPSRRTSKAVDRIHYVYFDFHQETKGLRWHRVQILLDRLADALDSQKYFRAIDMPGSTQNLDVRSMQTSVVRTNCMDCLDRTNVVQSMLARRALDRQLTDAGLIFQGQSSSEDSAFEHLFRNMWADNADVVSRAYSGTGALKTDFTRTGQRTRKGAFNDFQNSVTRYWLNNFGDGPRQDAYDLFLGAYLPSTSNIGSTLIFVDRRPLLIQAIPYILAASVFLVTTAALTRRLPDTTLLPLRIFELFWLAIALWCGRFIYTHGSLYVNWPKLNPLPWAIDGYSDAIALARKDAVIGNLVTRQDRSASNARLSYLEEGKKRIE